MSAFTQHTNAQAVSISEECEKVMPRVLGHTNTHAVQRIRYSRRPASESIVVVLLAEGFQSNQTGEFLNQARAVTMTMINTYPFSLFSHLFTVYAVQVVSRGQIGRLSRPHSYTGGPAFYVGGGQYVSAFEFNMSDDGLIEQEHIRNAIGSNSALGYFGSRFLYNADGTAPWWKFRNNPSLQIPSTGRNLAMDIANRAAGGANYLDMVQIIGRQPNHPFDTSAGRTWIPSSQANMDRTVGLAFTMACNRPSTIWQQAWHGTFMHELGHSFGWLADNHDDLYNHALDNRRANLTYNTNDVKWSHWQGHRNVAPTPQYAGTHNSTRWYVPSEFTRNASGYITGGNCIMVASHARRYFNGVASAELTRRMALITGETFEGRLPNGDMPSNSAVIMPEGATRILDSAFHGNTTLTTLTIPSTVTTIGGFAFLGATNLTTIRNYSTTPQAIDDTTFAGTGIHAIIRDEIRVHIPYGTYDAYRIAGWTDFRLIDPARPLTLTFRPQNTQAPFTQRVPYGNTITLPFLTKLGHDFLHWSLYDNPDAAFYASYRLRVTQDLTFVAHWRPRTLDIRYFDTADWSHNGNPFSGTHENYSTTHTFGTPTPLSAPTRQGFIFGGWFLNPRGTGQRLDYLAEYDFVQGVIRLYAKWLSDITVPFAGAGTESNPWQISDDTQLILLADLVNEGHNFNGNHFKLTNNINLSHTLWTPIGSPAHPFRGTFDGHNHLIYQFHTAGGNYQGLFGFVYTGTIKNLGIRYAHIYGNDFVGGIAGAVWYSSIFNSFNHGGLCEACYNCLAGKWCDGENDLCCRCQGFGWDGGGSVFGSWHVGGIVGKVKAQEIVQNGVQFYGSLINNVRNTSDVLGQRYVGGIAGSLTNRAGVFNSYNRGHVSGSYDVGGIAGRIHGVLNTIANNFNRGHIGGCCGYGCMNFANWGYFGGIVGRSHAGIFSAYGNCIVNNFNAGWVVYSFDLCRTTFAAFEASGGIAGDIFGNHNIMFNHFLERSNGGNFSAFGQAHLCCCMRSTAYFGFNAHGFMNMAHGPWAGLLVDKLNLMVRDLPWMIGIWGHSVHSVDFFEWVLECYYGLNHIPVHCRYLSDRSDDRSENARFFYSGLNSTVIIGEWLKSILQAHTEFLQTHYDKLDKSNISCAVEMYMLLSIKNTKTILNNLTDRYTAFHLE